jgi:hypothetical protein
MDKNELSRLAAEMACFVIENGLVDEEEDEWWLASLGAAVLFEADARGFENATEIAEEAVRLYGMQVPRPFMSSRGVEVRGAGTAAGSRRFGATAVADSLPAGRGSINPDHPTAQVQGVNTSSD